MKKVYNKLVRDNIPQIISSKGDIADYSTLTDGEMLPELNKKLKEEFDEYMLSGDIEELADMLEVMESIVKIKGVSIQSFYDIKTDKSIKNGSFEKKIFLKSVDSKA